MNCEWIIHPHSDEKDDIKEYRDMAKHVDAKTAKLFRHNAKDEVEHLHGLQKRLKTLG